MENVPTFAPVDTLLLPPITIALSVTTNVELVPILLINVHLVYQESPIMETVLHLAQPIP